MIILVKKSIVFISTLSLTLLSSAQSVFAAPAINICPKNGFEGLCNDQLTNLSTIVPNIITLLLILAVIIAVFFLIFGGIKWIISGGDKAAVEGARNTIVAAIIGLVIAFLAFLIINVIGKIFGVSLGNLQLPNIFTQ